MRADPLDQRREPDLSYVEQTARSIQPHLQRGQLIVLESTTYPRTTEELVLPILEQSGLRCPIAQDPEAEHIGFHRFGSSEIPFAASMRASVVTRVRSKSLAPPIPRP